MLRSETLQEKLDDTCRNKEELFHELEQCKLRIPDENKIILDFPEAVKKELDAILLLARKYKQAQSFEEIIVLLISYCQQQGFFIPTPEDINYLQTIKNTNENEQN